MEQHEANLKTGGELKCSRKISGSYFTNGTRSSNYKTGNTAQKKSC